MNKRFLLMALASVTALSLSGMNASAASEISSEERKVLEKYYHEKSGHEVMSGLKSLSCLTSAGIWIKYSRTKAQYQPVLVGFGPYMASLYLSGFSPDPYEDTVEINLMGANPILYRGVTIYLKGLPFDKKKTRLSGVYENSGIWVTGPMPIPYFRPGGPITCNFEYDYDLNP